MSGIRLVGNPKRSFMGFVFGFRFCFIIILADFCLFVVDQIVNVL